MANSHQLQKAALILPPQKGPHASQPWQEEFAVYISIELSCCCLSSLCVHMHSLPGLDKLCCQEIRLFCGKGSEGNSLRHISQLSSAFLQAALVLILLSSTALFSTAAALCKMQ